jgi:hypothetical protein
LDADATCGGAPSGPPLELATASTAEALPKDASEFKFGEAT